MVKFSIKVIEKLSPRVCINQLIFPSIFRCIFQYNLFLSGSNIIKRKRSMVCSKMARKVIKRRWEEGKIEQSKLKTANSWARDESYVLSNSTKKRKEHEWSRALSYEREVSLLSPPSADGWRIHPRYLTWSLARCWLFSDFKCFLETKEDFEKNKAIEMFSLLFFFLLVCTLLLSTYRWSLTFLNCALFHLLRNNINYFLLRSVL